MTWRTLSVVVLLPMLALAQTVPDYYYPTSQRIQISETCEKTARWLAQGMVPGHHWDLLRYEPKLGLVSFKIENSWLSKDKARAFTGLAKKNIRLDEVIFTLRTLVSSTVQFGNGAGESSGSCTIATAGKYVTKDGKAVNTAESLKDNYSMHSKIAMTNMVSITRRLFA
jgi:hypothetical protein